MKPDSPLVADVSPSPNFGDRRGRGIDALILHYTGMKTGPAARTRLLDPTSEVSAHYLVWEDGRIEQLVAERDRAWHAGRSVWHGETDMNAVSIGIEIVNGGHDFGCPSYPEPQIAAVIELAQDVCIRQTIPAARFLGHSDIAPDRKLDPGEWFPWERLAAAGLGRWTPRSKQSGVRHRRLAEESEGSDVESLQRQLAEFGYGCVVDGRFGAQTASIVAAFQRHFRPSQVDGIADPETIETLIALLGA